VPPLATLVVTETVPQGQVYLVALQQLAFDQDQALSITVSFDNDPGLTYTDPSLFRMAYIVPLINTQTGVIPSAQRQVVTTIVNLTGASQNLVVITGAGYMTNNDWQRIVNNFFSDIQAIITGQGGAKVATTTTAAGGT
jgi:hypothetical protein